MLLLGQTPLTAVALNLACYVVVVIAIAGAAGRERTAIFATAAITVSPALLIFGTQALKDTFGVTLICLALAGVRLWSLGLLAVDRAARIRELSGLSLLALAVFAISGLRAYYGLFLFGGFLGASAALVFLLPSVRSRVLLAHALAVPALWLMFVAGAGAYYPYYGSLVRASFGAPFAPLTELENARVAFSATGGGTAIDEPADDFGRDRAPVARLAQGVAAMFVPISLLRELGIVRFSGGRGLLLLTDLDTVMLDVSLIIAFFLMFRMRPAPVPSVNVFGLLVFLVTAVTMAYVVTNYGTLFRLRLLVSAPLWLLPAFAQMPDSLGVPALSRKLGW
jgi:hypothetical protein